MDYQTIRVIYNDEQGIIQAHTVGMAGVQRIYRDGWCPEPHCNVSVVCVKYSDGREKQYNLAYIPEIELEPLEPPASEKGE